MENQSDPKAKPANFRQKAEEIIKKTLFGSKPVELPGTETEVLKLIHEIEVHRIELEMQNDELVKAKKQFEKAAIEKYTELYDAAPTGYFTLSRNGKIIEVNHFGSQIIGINQSVLIGHKLENYISPDTLYIFKHFLENAINDQSKKSCYIKLATNIIPNNDVHLTGISINNGEQLLISMTDVSELKQATKKVFLFGKILQNMAEGVFLIRTDNREIVYANPAVEQMFGYAPEMLEGMNIRELIAPTDKSSFEIGMEIIQGIQKTGSWQGEILNLRKDGSRFWSIANVTIFDDTQYGSVYIAIMTDITERRLAHDHLKKSETELQKEVEQRTHAQEKLNIILKKELSKRKLSQRQLKNTVSDLKKLHAYMHRVREDEQISIARIIHDDLAQLLSSMKIELTLLKEKASKHNYDLNGTVESLMLLVDQGISAITTLIVDLRPVIPDNMGLINALKRLITDFQKRTGIHCEMRIMDGSVKLDREISTSIYRVMQEGLSNIRKHAQATDITVKIITDSLFLHITLQDNGIGISQENISNPMSFGIVGMKERVEAMQGKITFTCTPGKGTKIYLKIPLVEPSFISQSGYV